MAWKAASLFLFSVVWLQLDDSLSLLFVSHRCRRGCSRRRSCSIVTSTPHFHLPIYPDPHDKFIASSNSKTIPTLLSAAAAATKSDSNYYEEEVIPSFSLLSSSFSLSSLTVTTEGVADRAFRLGMRLEKNGQFRKATAAFHEAATWFSGRLECPTEFANVTTTPTSILTSSTTSSLSSEQQQQQHQQQPKEDEEIRQLLAYTCLRLGFLYYDALGDAKAAIRLYQQATMIQQQDPSSLTYDGLGTCYEASGAGTLLPEAVQAYRTALALTPLNRHIQFHLAVALERLVRRPDSQQQQLPLQPQSQFNSYSHSHSQLSKRNAESASISVSNEAVALLKRLRRSNAKYSCWVDSWEYVKWHTRNIPNEQLNLYRGTRDMLQLALSAAQPLIQQGGLCCEFGVGGGRSLRMIQEILPSGTELHGFDTFTGLPQAWGNEPIGTYSTGGVVPTLEGNVVIHQGLFRDTLPSFWEHYNQKISNNTNKSIYDTHGKNANAAATLAFANIDCDLYTSTLDILETLHSNQSSFAGGQIVPGTVLVFDEYIGHSSWRQDEFRAWRDCCERFGWKYEYLGFSLATKQAVVRVIE